jgi:hypothetical protein
LKSSLFFAMAFPVAYCKFPVLGVGNSTANRLAFQGPSMRDEPGIDEIPSIFSVIRESD